MYGASTAVDAAFYPEYDTSTGMDTASTLERTAPTTERTAPTTESTTSTGVDAASTDESDVHSPVSAAFMG